MSGAVDKEDLLQPALEGREPTQYRPWRLTSQVYVAFFGGALALGGIAFLNAAMLDMSYRARVAIVGLALAAEGALVAVVAGTDIDQLRIASTVAGLAAYGGAFLIQRSADRVYHFHADDDEPYQSLFGPGLVAVISARVFESVLFQGLQGA
jgi:hypothetical protein